MRILSFSSCFPSSQDAGRGVFVLHRLAAMARLAPLEAVHPYGRFPLYRSPMPPPAWEQEQLEGVTVYHRPFFYIPRMLKHLDAHFYARGVWPWLQEHVRSQRPDVLDAHFSWPDGVAVAQLAQRLGLPFVVTLRGVINSRIKIPRMREHIVRSLHQAAAIISVSDEMAQLAIRHGVDRGKIHVIPNGVDAALFTPRDRAESRRQLGLDPAGRCIVCVASIQAAKGMRELVEAMPLLPHDVKLLLVGSTDDAPAFVRELAALAASLNCHDRIVFAGAQPHDRVPLYIAAADVCVLASYAEGCPNAVIESLACGVPVVASSVGHVPQMITSGRNGLLVPPRDSSALAAAIAQALGRTWSPQEIHSSPAVVSWGVVARRTLDVLQRVVEGRP